MENNNSREIINFAKHITPLPIEVKQNKGDDKIVFYGADNLYPNFLLKLFTSCPLHSGIIETKTDEIVGNGLIIKGTGDVFNKQINAIDGVEEFTKKVIIDYLIFGYYAVEVIYNLLGKPIEFIHIPAQNVRANRSRTMFQVCDDWYANSRNVLSYDRWVKGKNEDGKSKIFFYSNYSPSLQNVYPSPDYSAAIKSLETDMAIREFHLNNITNGFSVASLITFYGAGLPPEQKRDFEKKIGSAYSGANGAKYIIDFQKPDGKPAEVKNISANDWDKAYEIVRKSVEQDVLSVHKVTSPLLFGIKTEGQLGGNSELETAYNIFKHRFVFKKRKEIEAGLNKLFSDAGFPTIEFKDFSLLGNTLSEATKEKVYTINELRKIENLEPLIDGDKLIGFKTPDAVKFSIQEPKKDENIYYSLTDEDFEKVKDLGTQSTDFELIEKISEVESFSDLELIENQFDDDDAIIKYLIGTDINGKSLSEIRTDIKKELAISISTNELKDKLEGLTASKLLNVKITGSNVESYPVPKQRPNKDTVEVLYSYEGPKDGRNRPFCSKLMDQDRYYTRSEIQTMTGLFGYDIFKFRGGWYHNPSTGVNTPYCRHKWVANKVKRK